MTLIHDLDEIDTKLRGNRDKAETETIKNSWINSMGG